MKKALRTVIIIVTSLVVLAGLSLLMGFPGLKETVNLEINDVELSRIPDGTYLGTYDNYRFSTAVNVTVSDHTIKTIESVKIQDGRESLIKELTDKIREEQTPRLDDVSGATASSNAYLKAVENALQNGIKTE